MSEKRKIIIVGNGYKNSISDDFFRDVIKGECENAVYYYLWEIKNPIIRFLKRLYYTKRWSIYKKFPFFERFFRKYHAFNRIVKDASNKNAIVIINLASQYANLISKDEIRELKKSELTLVLFCIDAIDSPQMNYGEIITWFPLFDMVITDNPLDSQKYNLFYHLDPYPWSIKEQKKKSKSDIFFLGRGKDRVDLCRRIVRSLRPCNVRCDLTIIGKEKGQKDGIRYLRRKVSYKKIIDGISATKCILEVLSYNNGASLRYFEAVVFNKKLITTNPDVSKLPFYNPKYMKFFESPEDLNSEWIKEDDVVDYGYDGCFSPTVFIDDIRSEIALREKANE